MAKLLNQKPKVTVLMAVYNGGKFLPLSIKSIISQSFEDFEFLIIDDGSTDKSLLTIKGFAEKDERIRVISRQNKGLIYSLNEGLKLAKGEYIARQDADDISLPNRLELQVSALEKDKSVAMVGSNYAWIDSEGKVINTTDVFTNSNDLKAGLIFCNQFGHGTVMLRKEMALKAGGYSKDHKYAEDYDLWTRLARQSPIINLKEVHYQWRHHKTSVSQQKAEEMVRSFHYIRDREFEFYTKNNQQYSIYGFHPLSTKGGMVSYSNKKARMLRDLSLLYTYRSRYVKGVTTAFLAILFQPFCSKNYKQVYACLFNHNALKTFEYEYL